MFVQGDMERVSYYIDLAAAICREVGAYNSDTYAKCMIGTVVDPMRTLEEKERVVMDYNRKVCALKRSFISLLLKTELGHRHRCILTLTKIA